MGRPSKLTPMQWSEIERRAAEGESASALAKEFNVGRSTISDRVSVISDRMRETAQKVADAQTALAAFPVAQQYKVLSIADRLRNISGNLAGAAEYGAATSHRLAAIANAQVQQIDDANPMDSQEALQAISALTKMSNDASVLGMNLINASKAKAGAVPDQSPSDRPSHDMADDELMRIAAGR